VDVLPAILKPLLDAIDRAGIGVMVLLHRNGKTEKNYINNALTRSLGYSPEEWEKAPLWYAIAPKQKVAITQIFDNLVSRSTPFATPIEVGVMHKDGHEITAEVTGGRLKIDDGGFAFIFIVRDINLHRQTQLSLLEADRLALVGALASGFAHETNNPLTSVLLNLRSLRKQVMNHMHDNIQTNAIRCLDDITTGAERIAGNVRALQTLATRSATQQIDLASVVTSALRLAAPTLEPCANVIRQIFPVAAVAGEESRIGQAVLAMMLFSSSGFDTNQTATSNRIVVAVEEREGWIVVEVSDNGRELTQEEADRAFDPFFRSSVRGAGVGVGLGVARSVATGLGGDVNLAPREGGGAVITMRLPPAPQPATT
jgi:PAS domain S-box-containing protein